MSLRREQMQLHPEHAEFTGDVSIIQSSLQTQSQNRSGVCGIDHAVVPQPRAWIKRMSLLLELCHDRILDLLLYLRRPLQAKKSRLALVVSGWAILWRTIRSKYATEKLHGDITKGFKTFQ